MFDDILKMYFN